MFFRLLPFLILIPLVELYIIIILGKSIGFSYTVLLIAATGIAGLYLIKQQGLQAMARLRLSLSQGQVPGNEVLDGLLILIGSAFLLTPGILTDIAGFTMLLPWSRKIYREFIKLKLYSWIKTGKLKKF